MPLKIWWVVIAAAVLVGLFALKRVHPSFWKTEAGKKLLRLLPPLIGAAAGAVGIDLNVPGDLGRTGILDALVGLAMGATPQVLWHAAETAKAARAKKDEQKPTKAKRPPRGRA